MEDENIYRRFDKAIKTVIANENIENADFKIEALKLKGRNYLSEIYDLDIKGEKSAKEIDLKLFIKAKLTINSGTETISIDDAYNREGYLYKNVFKIYGKLQEEANINECDKLKFATYYDTDDNDTIIMENLIKNGFDVNKPNKAVSLEFAVLGIEYIAKLHAMSFVMEAKMPEYFEKVKKELIRVVLQMGKRKTLEFIRQQCETAVEVMETEEARKKLSDVIFDKIEAIPKYFEETSPGIKCIVHNDFHVNNLMLKYDDKGVVTEIVALDYQTSFYGHPIADFIYFVLGATDGATRAKHMTEFKEKYYTTLSEHLSKFDLDVEGIYPRKIFDDDYDKFMVDVGLVKTLMVLGFVLAPEDDFPDMCKNSLAEIKPKTTAVYRKRVNELVQDVIDWGYL